MIELPLKFRPAAAAWFPSGVPGPALAVEHAQRTRVGRWWVDRLASPAAVAVSCADHLLLRGNPRAFMPDEMARFADMHVAAAPGFLPLLGTTFQRVVPWERMVFVRTEPTTLPPPPADVRLRRLTATDSDHLARLDPDSAWITRTWGGPEGLARSGRVWGAFLGAGLAAVACTYFEGERYEEVAVATLPGYRGMELAQACVGALDADITARGRIPSWNCARDNGASRRLAWHAGFRIAHEYVHYKTGQPRDRVNAAPGSRRPGSTRRTVPWPRRPAG